jgi:hypothetical protein
MSDILISDYFTDGEMWALTTALNQFMYDNSNLTEEQLALCEQAFDKIVKNM